MEFPKSVVLFDRTLAWKKGLKSKKHFSLWTKIMTAELLLPKWRNCLQLCTLRKAIIHHLVLWGIFGQSKLISWLFWIFLKNASYSTFWTNWMKAAMRNWMKKQKNSYFKVQIKFGSDSFFYETKIFFLMISKMQNFRNDWRKYQHFWSRACNCQP